MNQVITLNEKQMHNLEKAKEFIIDVSLEKLEVIGAVYLFSLLIEKGFNIKSNNFSFSVGA